MDMLKSLWRSLFSEKPKSGDLIEISRGLFQHWAICVGDGLVVHMEVPFLQSHMALVKKENLEDVVGRDQWKINNSLDKKHTPRPAEDIKMEALSLVGSWQKYSVTEENCEHFVTELRYGIPVSLQVEKVSEELNRRGVIGRLLAWIYYMAFSAPGASLASGASVTSGASFSSGASAASGASTARQAAFASGAASVGGAFSARRASPASKASVSGGASLSSGTSLSSGASLSTGASLASGASSFGTREAMSILAIVAVVAVGIKVSAFVVDLVFLVVYQVSVLFFDLVSSLLGLAMRFWPLVAFAGAAAFYA